MELRDSRRLTGPNLLSEKPGAILDCALGDEPAEPLIAAWREQADRILDAVGWAASERATRAFPGGASLFLSAPVDALYAATEVNEWAFEAAVATLEGRPAPRLAPATARLRLAIAEESNPALLELERAAQRHGVAFLSDDEQVSVGLGAGSATFPVDTIPSPEAIDWRAVHNVPVALVTGTNGKTTTVRMLAAIAAAAGHRAGYTSTDGIVVDGETTDAGDWSGPGGARRLLRDRRVEWAVLECARGGMLRRGLPVRHADVAVITNVAADHLGEWGVADLEALADAKWIVSRAARRLVLNADDTHLARRGDNARPQVSWFSLAPDAERRRSGARRDGDTLWLLTREDGVACRHADGRIETLFSVRELPATLGGAARHNTANALAAAAAAQAVSVPQAAIVAGLTGFRDNPGRLHLLDLGGVRVLIDFAHNPHGLAALVDTLRAFRPQRWLLTLGQAGDRSDEDLRGLARTAASAGPDRILVKELQTYLRGRARGEIPRILAAELAAAGFPPDRIGDAESEMDSVRQALRWARPGDFLLLLTVVERSAVLTYLTRLQQRDWRPGSDLAAPSGQA
ncbi:MAG: Mur ligase family protein [Thermoanaerobaculia bacterium]